jgi:hypothetical protein
MCIPLRARPSFDAVRRFLFRRLRPSVILEAEPDETGSVIVSLPVSILVDIAAQNPNFVMEIRAPFGSDLLPGALPTIVSGWKELFSESGREAEKLGFRLTLADRTEDQDIRKALSAQLPGGKLIGAIVDVHLEMFDADTGEVVTVVRSGSW